MSLATWRDEFYPRSALHISNDPSATPTQLIQHSLQKWKGVLRRNLKKHNLKQSIAMVFEANRRYGLEIGGESCSLCHEYRCVDHHPVDSTIISYPCPLWLNDEGCDVQGSAWREFIYDDDPRPMIKALKKTLKLEKKNEFNYLDR